MPLLVALVLVGESLLIFGVPGGGSAKVVNVDMAPITFLQKNEGHYRFLDFAVITPNWGSQYGLNELNAIDLPFPEKFSQLIERQLYPGLTPSNQFVIHDGIIGLTAQENELVTHFKNYEAASVKYLVMSTALVIEPALTKLGVTKVFSDAKVNIYELPNPQPFFSTTSSSCTVKTAGVNKVSGGLPGRRHHARSHRTDDGGLEGLGERQSRHDQDDRPRRLSEREGASRYVERHLQLLATTREVRHIARVAGGDLPHWDVVPRAALRSSRTRTSP